MTGAICTRWRTSLVLLGFLAMGVPTCKSENQCYHLRLDDALKPCKPIFPDDDGCHDNPLETITIINATVTVNALLDHTNISSGFTKTVDATDAANSIAHCSPYTCGSLALILLSKYSTQYCLGVNPDPGLLYSIDYGVIYIDAVVSVNYTRFDNETRTFTGIFDGLLNGIYQGPPSCSLLSLVEESSPSEHHNDKMTTYFCHKDFDPTPTPPITTMDPNFMKTSATRSYTRTSPPAPTYPTTPSSPQPVSSSEPPSTPETSTALSTTHDVTTPSSTPEISTAQPSTNGVNILSTPTITPGITPRLSLTHGTTPLQSPSTAESCGDLVSEEIRVDEVGGNQQCGSTFTFHFSSLNVTNVTVRYAYIPRDEISGNADNVQLASNDQEGSVVRVISTVIEISLTDGDTTIRLTDGSVDIIFKINSTEDFPPNNDSSVVHCAYMVNESTWSTEGLRVVSVNSDSVVCHSSHLTSFAVLLSVKPPEGIHAKVQSYMSYLLGAISIASLTLAVLIYCVTGTYKILKIQIDMNLAIATALGQLLFITMAESTWNRAICKGVAVTLHYLFTATLAWTMIEGIFLYRTTAVGFKPLKIGWLSLIAWGSSLVVVGVSFGIKFDTYGQSNYCWLYAEDYTIYIFAACVFGTELFSFVVLWFVMRVFNSLKANKNKDAIDKFKATARALFIILPIIGLTWLAGTITSISASDDVIPFQYIFIITFSLQGVCILVFHCLMVPDVKTAIKLRMNRRVTDKSWANSKSTKSTASSTL